MYIERDIEQILEKTLHEFPALVVTGPRQTGKSTLLLKKFGKEYKYITFDDLLVRERASEDPVLFLDTAGDKVIFDEIQYIPQLLSFIKIKIDADRSTRGKYILIGSQQFNLMKNIGETLAGRTALFTLLPFNINEINRIEIKDITGKSQHYFSFASINGLFPENCIHQNTDNRQWYAAYIQTYLERDIRTLYNLGNLRDFSRFIRLLASNCSQIFNLSSYARDIGVSVNTIKNWLSILEAGHMIYIMEPYYKNPGKRMIKSPKIYWNDNGLVCYLTGIYNKEHLYNGPMAGALFENLVIQETIKHFYNAGLTPDLYYLRTSNGVEIDLIIEFAGKIFPYEIKLTKSPKLSMAKHIDSLRENIPDFDIQKGALISMSDTSYPLSQTVDVLNFNDYIRSLSKFH